MKPTWKSDCGTVKLWLGDCLEVMQSWPDGAVNAVVTDPPYGINRQYATHVDDADTYEFFATARVLEACRVSSDFMVSFSSNSRLDLMVSIVKQAGLSSWVLVWHKTNAMGCERKFCPVWVPIVCGYGSKSPFFGQDVFACPIVPHKGIDHPTPKPLPLMSAIVGRTRGTIADPFMGSGTTGVAAVRLGRKFWGVEIDLEYFESAKRRIQDELRRVDFLEPTHVKERQLSLIDE